MIGEGEFLLTMTRVKWQVLVREDTNQNTERFGNPIGRRSNITN